MQKDLKTTISHLPQTPGIYMYKNTEGKVIYVGKAKRLKNRVKSYFQTDLDPVSKTAALVKNIADIEYIETLSELEALVLEAHLIKIHKPKYNVALKDDKSYLYIVIRPSKVTLNSQSVNIPVVLTAREGDLQKKDKTFGPYPSSNTAKYVARSVRKAFPYRDCSHAKFKRYNKAGQPCLYGHIGLCQAPCTGLITPVTYRSQVARIERFLSGESAALVKSFQKAMQKAAREQNFEEAAYLRDQLSKFDYIRQKATVAQQYVDNPYLVQDLREKALVELVRAVPLLTDLPQRIECYDISTISGSDSVGSMVVALGGETAKSEYRRFKINTTTPDTPDDFAMLNEVLRRRLKGKNLESWGIPDLIVVDGGKGQVSSGLKVLDAVNMDIPLIGLAKKYETIVYYDRHTHQFIELNLPPDNEGQKLLIKLRNEAHRFAQSYHHKLRLKHIKYA